MAMELNSSIQKAIQDSLPLAVAGELKDYIATAQKTAEAYSALQQVYITLKADYDRLLKLELRENDVTKREEALRENDRDIKTRLQLVTMREEHAKERIDEIKNLTATVFQSNRMNYNVSLGMPVQRENDQYGSQKQVETFPVMGNITKQE